MMLSYRDKTFCKSPGCKNDCGRKITEKEREEAQRLDMPICWGYFCGDKLELLPGITVTGNATVKMGPGCSVTALEGLKDK